VSFLIGMHLFFGAMALLVMAFVAFPYRGRHPRQAQRLTQAVAAVTERVSPAEAPPRGVLTTPEKARQVSARFERAEVTVRRRARALVPVRGAD
jgi:hypothetical protein